MNAESHKNKDDDILLDEIFTNGTLKMLSSNVVSTSEDEENEGCETTAPSHKPQVFIGDVGTKIVKELQVQIREMQGEGIKYLLRIEKIKDKLFVEWVSQ
jgi:hypothetical protein